MPEASASSWIESLALIPHPEGGYFRESYRANASVTTPSGTRSASTAIYYLLERGDFSALHRILSDEVWHFYAGDALEIVEFDEDGRAVHTRLGKALDQGETLQHVVAAGRWFASRPLGAYSLVGCTVAPGFDFQDFEMGARTDLMKTFPEHAKLIESLTRT